MEPIASQLVSLTVAAVFGVVTGYLGGKVRRLTARDKAIEQGIGIILRRQLLEDFDRYVVQGEPLTVEKRREIDECWAAYDGLELNGTGHKAYEALCALDLTL